MGSIPVCESLQSLQEMCVAVQNSKMSYLPNGRQTKSEVFSSQSRMNLSSAMTASSVGRLDEPTFFSEFPQILNRILLGGDSDDSNGAPSLLDLLDNAFYEYNVRKMEEAEKRRNSMSHLNFFRRDSS